MELTWKEVLDSNRQIAGMHFAEFLPIVVKTKYDYFTWNGRIFKYCSDWKECYNNPVQFNTRDMVVADIK
jgi:hypothetical protein